ncbi:UDP-N-acetylmuramoylalanine--D-glutamate ligase [Candidatus Methanobinarius endosymbioticus]|uniref:UDP-N-acetylmuramoylalanine--D-glutamate ligase n=1 Tax=Candidatus Methanobinarius endosymbioticus TaxID=2006182 RepID=A0A366MAI1_9EURY|nr:UDP-N-acetylmuramoylalanine--D-glutamate ligase [Candidatus Methanobinarius endosymbioticus]
MRTAVIGLGVEGIKAIKSLLENDWDVYATDLKTDINLEDLEISYFDVNFFTENDYITISNDNLIIDLGFNDMDTIFTCDAIVLSPSLWNTQLAKGVIESGKHISDMFTDYKNIFTIGITGTNGKTTTISMLKEILENSGKKVLIGGNAGGGFNGYCDILLKAEKENYDIILVEVCDMTLAYCDYFFDFDIIGITNIGNDHMDVHGSIENYKNSLIEFFKGKTVFVDNSLKEFNQFSDVLNYNQYKNDLKVVGEFNKLNAGLASEIAKYLELDDEIINKTLKNFEAIEGRLKKFRLNDSEIFIGKTDNSNAVKSLLDEKYFYAIFIGTPRVNEEHRFDILNVVSEYNPEVIVLFPGLDDTIDYALYRLNSIGYDGRIEIANNLDEIIRFVAEYSHENSIFIGGNGQQAIIEIQERLEALSQVSD